jgi:hypothetical protein
MADRPTPEPRPEPRTRNAASGRQTVTENPDHEPVPSSGLRCNAAKTPAFGPCSGDVETLIYPLPPTFERAGVQVNVCDAHRDAAGRVVWALVNDITAQGN